MKDVKNIQLRYEECPDIIKKINAIAKQEDRNACSVLRNLAREALYRRLHPKHKKKKK